MSAGMVVVLVGVVAFVLGMAGMVATVDRDPGGTLAAMIVGGLVLLFLGTATELLQRGTGWPAWLALLVSFGGAAALCAWGWIARRWLS